MTSKLKSARRQIGGSSDRAPTALDFVISSEAQAALDFANSPAVRVAQAAADAAARADSAALRVALDFANSPMFKVYWAGPS